MSEAQPIENTSDLFAIRQQKLEAMRANGFDPFRANWEQSHTSAQARGLYNEDETQSPVVSVAGRIMFRNLMGKASFLRIQDRDGVIQLYLKLDVVGAERYEFFKHSVDIGDIIGAEGTLFKTKTGEITLRATRFALVSKALRPLPEKWSGLTDPEQIARQRYLDLISNEASRKRFQLRSRIISRIRRFLEDRGFMEYETPVLQGQEGGAAARPFRTHFNALNCEFVLRIALELHLKRLLVGGLDRVFELGRVFRNEGVSRRHNPEFTMLELYQAYSDYRGMMALVTELIQTLAREVVGTTSITMPSGAVIELGGTWREARYKDLVIEAVGDADWFSRSKEHKIAKAHELGVEATAVFEDYEVTNAIFGKLVEPKLLQPTFVTHLPKELCPLAKITEGDSTTIDVFELCINGQEIAPAYSEQNDPAVQRQMFMAQVGEEVQKLDEDFLTALEHGMPPAGGMGIGIDRLCILLTGAESIRDTILFPALRPENQA